MMELCFKGQRTYLHGTDIFNLVSKKLLISDLNKIDLTFHGVAKHALVLKEQKSEGEEAKFIYTYQTANGAKISLFGIDTGNEVTCRYDYDEESIIEASSFNMQEQKATLRRASDYSFIENIVAMNKELLQRLFPDQIGKWYFTRLTLNQPQLCFKENANLQLRFQRHFNFKLTRSEIYVGLEKVGFIFFSLVNE